MLSYFVIIFRPITHRSNILTIPDALAFHIIWRGRSPIGEGLAVGARSLCHDSQIVSLHVMAQLSNPRPVGSKNSISRQWQACSGSGIIAD
jgi:hypothetical protein